MSEKPLKKSYLARMTVADRLYRARTTTLPVRRREPLSLYAFASKVGVAWETAQAWEEGVLSPTPVELAAAERALGLARGALTKTPPAASAAVEVRDRPPGWGAASAFRSEETETLVRALKQNNPGAGRLEDPLRAVLEIERLLARHVFRRLDEAFGPGESGGWAQGVPLKVRVDAATLRENDPKRLDLRAYLHLIDLKVVVLKNWKLFADAFAAEPERSKDDNLSWMTRLNTLRNSLAHAVREEFGDRISEDELAFVRDCLDWARLRLK